MDLALSESQELIRASLRDYLRREVPFSRVRRLEASGGYDEDLWRHLQQDGFLDLPFGGGGDLMDLGIVVEELARRAAVVPLVETLTCAMCIARFGSAQLASEVIRGVVEGSFRISPALLEREDRYDAAEIALQDGVVAGCKRFVDYAPWATHFLVSARAGDELVLALVDSAPSTTRFRALDNISRLPQANVTFDRSSARRVAGEEALRWLFSINQALSAVQCLGCAEQALELTVEYVKVREQFGQPIGAFQAVQHHCADMATMIEASRFLTYEALWLLNSGNVDARTLAIAKNHAARSVTEVTMLAHELHGGIGATEDYDLHFFSRRGKDRAIAWGSGDETLRFVASSLEGSNRWH